MIQNTIFQYVLTLFDESWDGELIAGDADNQFDYPVEWDEQTANELAQQCGTLVGHFTELSNQFEKLRNETRHLTKEQLEIWNTYLRPFPKHGLDMETLQTIWEKFEIDAPVTEEERSLADQYVNWFEKNALTRLPHKCCHPALMINHAKRYCKLVRLNAPESVQENEAKRFAEEFVLYHCMKQNTSK
jgi:hypothetical protein